MSDARTALVHLAIRLAERIGVANEEMELKDRKSRAAQILRDHGAHFVNFLGRFSIEALQP